MSLSRMARKPALTITADVTVMKAIEMMMLNQAGALAVVDGKKLIGIFSERDVMSKVVYAGLDPKTTTLDKVMTTEIATVRDDVSVKDAIAMMGERRIRHLPIVDAEGEIEGMISLRLLMHDWLDDVMSEVSSLESYMTADGPGG